MTTIFFNLLTSNYPIDTKEAQLMLKTMRQLKKGERRYYFKHIKPKVKTYQKHLRVHYTDLDADEQKKWLDAVTQSMLARGGEPSIIDSLTMNAIGRLSVYNYMRLRAEKEGIKLSALTNFGGMGAVIMLVGVGTALVLYFLAK